MHHCHSFLKTLLWLKMAVALLWFFFPFWFGLNEIAAIYTVTVLCHLRCRAFQSKRTFCSTFHTTKNELKPLLSNMAGSRGSKICFFQWEVNWTHFSTFTVLSEAEHQNERNLSGGLVKVDQSELKKKDLAVWDDALDCKPGMGNRRSGMRSLAVEHYKPNLCPGQSHFPWKYQD